MFQLRFAVDQCSAEQLSEQLSEVGAVAVTFQDGGDEPLYEPPPGETALWRHNYITALFATRNSVDAALVQLRRIRGEESLPAFVMEELEEKEWERVWMEDFHPIRFGSRLWIVPSWTDAPDPDAVNILLDPGLAFGTGTHPTTALCLEWLDKTDLDGKRLVDYGCGSGILAIAAAKLGASGVVAIDHDLQALEATFDNAKKNGVQSLIVVKPPEKAAIETVDIVIANILSKPLIALSSKLAARVKTGGKIALSGILREQADTVIEAYRPWFNMNLVSQKDEWLFLSGERLS